MKAHVKFNALTNFVKQNYKLQTWHTNLYVLAIKSTFCHRKQALKRRHCNAMQHILSNIEP